MGGGGGGHSQTMIRKSVVGVEEGARDSETDMNNKLLYSALKTSTQNHACSQRQIHTVHTCQLSQAKTKPYIKTIL